MTAEQVPSDDDLDPAEETPEVEEDTADDATSESPVDWEARYKEAQKVIGKQGSELAGYRSRVEEPEAEPDEAEPDGDAYLADLEEQNFKLAERVVRPETIAAYDAVASIWSDAKTPADNFVALEAFGEAYAAARAGGAPASEAAAAASSDERTRPRVDSNRSDVAPASVSKAEAEAQAKGDIGALFTARMNKALGR